MSAKIVLQVMSGPIRGKVFAFDKHDTFLFGRGQGCHARLPNDRYVSRYHFLLEVNPPEAAIRDLGSLNGTYVNGVRYGGRRKRATAAAEDADGRPQTPLKDRDVIVVGRTKIRVRTAASRQAAAVAAKLHPPTETDVVEGKPAAAAANDRQAAGAAAGQPAASATSGFKQGAGLRALIRQAAKDFQSRQKIEVEGYQLGEILGQGGMGVVYKAVRKADQFPVAVKVMLAKVAVQDKVRKRFLREIDVIRQLQHESIVALIACGAVENAFFFVTEYCNGGSRADLAGRQGGRLSLPVLTPIFLQSLKGLAYAHRQGFIHRDLKPANILLHQQQRGWAAKLSDFGLAKHFEHAGLSGMTVTGAVAGTYDYMPREQLTDFKNAKPASDVWSIGATFYRVLTGSCPRPCPGDRDPMEVVLQEEHMPLRQCDPSLPAALAGVIDKSLAVEAADRYQDAGEMCLALEAALAGSDAGGSP